MTEIAVLPQKVVDTKTSVLKSRLDSRMARNLGEQLKRRFFRNFGFLKPAAEDVQLVGFEKYYEPYLVIGGIYSIDYCRQHICRVKVGENTREIFVGGKKFRSEASEINNHSTRIVKLLGEEVAHYEKSTYYVLDRFGREIAPQTFTFGPYEDEAANNSNSDANFRRFETSVDADVEFLRNRIAKRPSDMAELMREVFEINERTIVYRPLYELTFQDLKTSREATLQIDAVSGKMILIRYRKRNTDILSSDHTTSSIEDLSTEKLKLPWTESKPKPENESLGELKQNKPNSPQIETPTQSQKVQFPKEDEVSDFPADIKGEIFTVGDNVTAILGDLEIPSGTNINELLVVKGSLKIGDKCRVSRKLKAMGDIIIGSETIIEDNLVSGGNVIIGANSVIHGSIKSAGRIEFKETTVGEKDRSKESVAGAESLEFVFAGNEEKNQSVVSREE